MRYCIPALEGLSLDVEVNAHADNPSKLRQGTNEPPANGQYVSSYYRFRMQPLMHLRLFCFRACSTSVNDALVRKSVW